MLNLDQIKKYYPPKMHNFPLGMLREYIQYLILDIIYHSQYAQNLIFMGGTALRIVHANQRFSEDLDFDNQGLSKQEFINLSNLIDTELSREGFQVEIRNTFGNAFHCYVKIPQIMHDQGLSGLPEQKIIVRIDTEPQNYVYPAKMHLLDKFTVLVNIQVVPLPVLLAQKIAALLSRKRAKGRDFFDVSYLLSREIEPDMNYLAQKIGISSKVDLKRNFKERLRTVDLKTMAIDVKPFLLDPSHIVRVENFCSFVEQL